MGRAWWWVGLCETRSARPRPKRLQGIHPALDGIEPYDVINTSLRPQILAVRVFSR
jgi:hypothetical protein